MDCKREFTVIQIERLLLPVKWKKLDYTCTYFVKSTPLRAFIGGFQHFADMLQIHILKMCMKKFDAEKNIFYKLTVFLT